MKQFEKNAEAYNRVRGKITYPDALYAYLSSLTEHHNSALDIGCGNGVSTIRLAEYYQDVHGCDLGNDLIVKAKENYPRLTFTASPVEDFTPTEKFDLITSATSFYWMDRPLVARKISGWLNPGGVFCAYKYDFPVVYGPLRTFIERELANRWSYYRDDRLTAYDNTLEILQEVPTFSRVTRNIFSNIIHLTPLEVAYFFLSTSYVTRYIEETGLSTYADEFITSVIELEPAQTIPVNFDIFAFVAQKGK